MEKEIYIHVITCQPVFTWSPGDNKLIPTSGSIKLQNQNLVPGVKYKITIEIQ